MMMDDDDDDDDDRTGAVSHNCILHCPIMHIMPQLVAALIKSDRQ